MRTSNRTLIAVTASLVWWVVTAHTAAAWAAPTELAYQGSLTLDDGTPFVGDVALEVSLFDASDGSVAVWGPVLIDPLPVIDGRFDLVLGSGAQPAISEAMAADAAFIEVTVDGVTLTPRQALVAAPYAFRAADADLLAGVAIDALVMHADLTPYAKVAELGAVALTNSYADLIDKPQLLQGPVGDTGDTGPQGMAGPKGDTGDTGPQGMAGPKGDTGDTGSQGMVGPKGDTGDAGSQGVIGPKGDTGDAGSQGMVGPKGDTGDTGQQGMIGDTGPAGVGFGLDASGYQTLGAAVAAVEAPGVLVISAALSVTGDVTVPRDVELLFVGAGRLVFGAAARVDIASPFGPGLRHVFDITDRATQQVRFGPGAVDAVHPQWWGAAADGVTDDIEPIRAAVDAGTAARVPTAFTGGTYLILGSIIASTNAHLQGRGGVVHVAVPDVPNISGILVNGATHSNITVEGMHLINLGASYERPDGPAADAAVGIFTGVGSLDTGIVNSRIMDNELEGFGQGLSLKGARDAAGNRLSPPAYDLRETPTITDMVGFEGRVIIRGNYIHHTRAVERIGSGGGHGMNLGNLGYCIVDGNRIDGMQGGILAARHSVISNNVVLNAWDDNGIYCPGCRYTTIVGNYIENAKADGIGFNGGQRNTVSGNMIVNPDNGGIRLQKAQNITITGNYFYLEHSSIGVRTHVNVGEGSSHNIVIADNIFEGPLRVANRVIGVVGDSGDPASNWSIRGNIFRAFDVSSLTGGFFGNGTLIRFHDTPAGEPAEHIQVIGNTFDDIVPGADDFRGMKNLLTGHTRERDNVFTFVDAAGTVTGTLDSGLTHGSCRVALGGSGVPVPTSTKCSGLVTGIVKGGATGEYSVTLARRILLTSFSATSTGANAPARIQLKVPSANSVQSGYVDTVTLVLLDANGAPVWPHFNSLLLFEIGTTEGLD